MAYKDESMGLRGNIRCEVTQGSQSISGNTTQVRVRGLIRCDSGSSSTDNTNNCKSEINGTYGNYGPVTTNFSVGDSWKEMVDRTFTVPHDANGYRTVTFEFVFGPTITSNFGSSKDGVSCSLTLTRIPKAPKTMAAPGVVQNTPGLVTVSYTPPDNMGSAITEYLIRYADNPAMTGAVVVSNGTSTSRVIGALGLNKTWYFQVAAKNAVGTGTYSAAASYLIPGVPGIPNVPSLVLTPPNTVAITFSAPASDGGAPITSYDVQYSTQSDFSNSTIKNTPGSPLSVTDLSPGATYYFRVRAKNSQGDGEWSSSSNVLIVAGPRIRVAGVYRTTVCYIKVAGVWRVAVPYSRVAGTWRVAGG